MNNKGDVYSIDCDTFSRTYESTGPGMYVKRTPVWAEVAREVGVVRTKEGATHYEAGDYLVYNEPDGGDAYAVAKDAFGKDVRTVLIIRCAAPPTGRSAQRAEWAPSMRAVRPQQTVLRR